MRSRIVRVRHDSQNRRPYALPWFPHLPKKPAMQTPAPSSISASTYPDQHSPKEIGGSPRCPPMVVEPLFPGDLLLAVGDAPDGAVPVVGDQERTVLHLHHIDRPADIFVVFQEAGDERLDVLD